MASFISAVRNADFYIKKQKGKRKMVITIGIPTFNEEKVISRAIYSVLNQISKKDEIIVVASGCTDNTVPIVRAIAKKDKRVRLITERERRGKASAINLIIKNAKGDIIVQTDGDVEVEYGAIKYLLGHFKNKKVGAVSGNPIPIIPQDNLFFDWTKMSYRKIGELREKEMADKTFNVHLSGYLLAFRKKALKEVPFAKGAVDAWMGKIIKENGYYLTYEPKARVYVRAPLNIKDFLAQKARVRAGYAYLPEAPRTMKSEIFYFPRELLRIPLWRWPQFIFCGFVYLYSWFLGGYFKKKDKSLKEIWKTPESTKRN